MRKGKAKNSKKPAHERTAANGEQTAPIWRDWKPFLSQYEDLRCLYFKSEKEEDAAIDLLWTPELRNLPHSTPDGKAIIVPAEAVCYFAQAGLRFTESNVLSIGDLSPEEIRRLRSGR
jgi:hypothetical protein